MKINKIINDNTNIPTSRIMDEMAKIIHLAGLTHQLEARLKNINKNTQASCGEDNKYSQFAHVERDADFDNGRHTNPSN